MLYAEESDDNDKHHSVCVSLLTVGDERWSNFMGIPVKGGTI